jgi:outer membrane protein OmpA-like peptidoglycan-associated protein
LGEFFVSCASPDFYMIPIRLGIFACIIALCVSCSKPIAVTHWTAKDRSSVNKGRASFGGKKPFGYPSHKWYSKVICFDDKCRNKAAWVKKQRAHKFKGFKDGGKLPTPPPRNNGVNDSTKLIAKAQPKKTTPVVKQPAAPVIQQPVQTEAPKADSLIVLSEFLFEVNSFKLKPELFPELDSLADFMKANPTTKIEISGHTDASGNESHNLRLSENRADAVGEYIVDKGIATSRVTFNGYGSSRPIAPNNTEQGKRKNRRVEILIHDRK